MWLVRLDTGSPEQQDNSKLPNLRPNLILIILQRDEFNSYKCGAACVKRSATINVNVNVCFWTLFKHNYDSESEQYIHIAHSNDLVNQSSTFILLIAMIFENKNSCTVTLGLYSSLCEIAVPISWSL